MDATRYFFGVILIVGIPPAVLYWLLVHPFVGFWRRLGPRWAIAIVGTICALLCVFLFRWRLSILGADLGTNWFFVGIGVLFYGVSAWMSILTKRQLSVRTFSGMPELAGDGARETLLEEGIYAVVRHPRYLSVVVGTFGFAMVVNYVGSYLMVLGTIPTLFLVAFLEERELVDRFGDAYRNYRERVPALFPGFGAGSGGPRGHQD